MLGEDMGSVFSFKPISDRSARVLILGSMPGKDSLKANQYYANRQNSFWKIMAELTGVPHTAPYEQRTAGLIARGIALWDVLESCTRPGSLDSRIVRSTAKANDFTGFFWLPERYQSSVSWFTSGSSGKLAVIGKGSAATRINAFRLSSPASTPCSNADRWMRSHANRD